jgi:hypothetical protein
MDRSGKLAKATFNRLSFMSLGTALSIEEANRLTATITLTTDPHRPATAQRKASDLRVPNAMQRAVERVAARARSDRVVDLGAATHQTIDIASETGGARSRSAAIVVVAARDAVEGQLAVTCCADLPASAALARVHDDHDSLSADASTGRTAECPLPGSGKDACPAHQRRTRDAGCRCRASHRDHADKHSGDHEERTGCASRGWLHCRFLSATGGRRL